MQELNFVPVISLRTATLFCGIYYIYPDVNGGGDDFVTYRCSSLFTMKHRSQELIAKCVTIISYIRRMGWSQTRDCRLDISWCSLHSACSSLHNHTLPYFRKLFVQTERSHSSDPSTLHNQQLWGQNNSNKTVIISNTKTPLVNCINIDAH